MHVRAKVLIPTILFVAIAIPAILVPTILAQQPEPPTNRQPDTNTVDSMMWETNSEPRDSGWELSLEDLEECLDSYIGD